MSTSKHLIPQDEHALCARAAEMIKVVGFEFRCASMKSEATYYALPGMPQLLRIGRHAQSRTPIGMGPVVARLTIRGTGFDGEGMIRISEDAFVTKVAIAIGVYMLESVKPIQSRYHGKKGCWNPGDPVRATV